MGKRSFGETSIVATGVQNFERRFGKKRRFDHDTPPISQWRCNLTGLSQIHNLYFVAYDKGIFVYTPQFLSQSVSENPTLILSSQPSSPNLQAYLDQRNPRAINNLIVQFLGNEEVVAVVRDDGDVDAFLVRHVVQAIERRKETENSLELVAHEIRPFFQSNAGKSAWGLSIHAQARILATSSNAHEVRVFKFGLLQTDDGLNAEDTDDTSGDNENKPRGRKTDVTHQVLNGESNIPHISFCNTGDDPEGRWLLTTDISGVCRVMDLHELRPVQAFRFGRSFLTPHSGGFDRLSAGWAIMFLDRRSFQPEDDVCEALGMDDEETLPGLKRNPRIWDLSKTVERLPESSEPFVYHRTKRRGNGDHSSSPIGPTVDIGVDSPMPDADDGDNDDDEEEEEEEEQAPSEPSDISDDSGGVEIDIEVPSDRSEDAHDDEREEDEDPWPPQHTIHPNSTLTQQDLDHEQYLAMQQLSGIVPPSANTLSEDEAEDEDDLSEDDSPLLFDDALDDPTDEQTEDSTPFTSFYSGTSICGNEPSFIVNNSDLCADLPCPILHASIRNIYLLQPSNQTLFKGPNVPPMVGFANPLRQSIQQDFEYLRIFERLNMNASIPALGIVILASQKGRALVLQLTKTLPSSHYPAGLATYAHKSSYAMRIAAVLPFADQEKKNERPFAPLHGIAVSPIQGSEGLTEEKRRWRLMMMYQDHSILSYQLSRGDRSDGVVVV